MNELEKMATESQNYLFNRKDAAMLIGMTVKEFRRLEDDGELRAQRETEGGHRRYSLEYLKQFVQKQNREYKGL